MKSGATVISNAGKVKLSCYLAARPCLLKYALISFSGFRTNLISDKKISSPHRSYVYFFYTYCSPRTSVLLLRFPLCLSHLGERLAHHLQELLTRSCRMSSHLNSATFLLPPLTCDGLIIVAAPGCDFLLVFVYSSQVCLQNEFPISMRLPD